MGKRVGAYRADSASYQAEMINALEADGVRWAITADQDAAVKGLLCAHFTHHDHSDRSIMNSQIGHRERSEATLGVR